MRPGLPAFPLLRLTPSRAISSAGRAPPRQGGGHWFEPSIAHLERPRKSGPFAFLGRSRADLPSVVRPSWRDFRPCRLLQAEVMARGRKTEEEEADGSNGGEDRGASEGKSPRKP